MGTKGWIKGLSVAEGDRLLHVESLKGCCDEKLGQSSWVGLHISHCNSVYFQGWNWAVSTFGHVTAIQLV